MISVTCQRLIYLILKIKMLLKELVDGGLGLTYNIITTKCMSSYAAIQLTINFLHLYIAITNMLLEIPIFEKNIKEI